MTRLFFIRHAESEANNLDILAGQMDFPLSKKGENDAALIADSFHSLYDIDEIYSSPLKRAKQTAQPFADLFNKPIQIDNRIMEQNLGIYQGKSYSELENEQYYEHDRTKRWNWIPANGESYMMMAERIKPFLEMCVSMKSGKNILVVTHAVTLRIIKGLLENTLPHYPSQIAKNGEIWISDFDCLDSANTILSINLLKTQNSAAKE
jgi:broad specificity phosphatase PhoE